MQPLATVWDVNVEEVAWQDSLVTLWDMGGPNHMRHW